MQFIIMFITSLFTLLTVQTAYAQEKLFSPNYSIQNVQKDVISSTKTNQSHSLNDILGEEFSQLYNLKGSFIRTYPYKEEQLSVKIAPEFIYFKSGSDSKNTNEVSLNIKYAFPGVKVSIAQTATFKALQEVKFTLSSDPENSIPIAIFPEEKAGTIYDFNTYNIDIEKIITVKLPNLPEQKSADLTLSTINIFTFAGL